MAYRDVLLHLDDSESCPKRIDAAVGLAAEHGAHLTGLYPIVEVRTPSFIWAQLPPEICAGAEQRVSEQADAMLAVFRQAAERRGISYETRTDHASEATLAPLVSMHARYADLLILGQVDPGEPPPVGRHLPEEVVLSSGRPVLMVPYIGAPATFGQRVVVAWDASREAARAVSDAMPILERAASVLVVSVDGQSAPLGHGAVPGADIGAHLARHNLKVNVQQVTAGGVDVASVLLSHIADLGADLLVMGAYAHARVRELMLGGVTRTVLQSMTVPVLMAH